MKTIRIFLLILIIIGIGLLLTQKIWVPKLVNKILLSENNSISIVISSLENKLLGTAWTQLDNKSNPTDEEIDFLKTKENDPNHVYYDYQEYLHQRPGEIGYWKLEGDTITIIGNPSGISPIVYIHVNIVKNILTMTDSTDNSQVKFKKFTSVLLK